jgi:type III pantothenate kinase
MGLDRAAVLKGAISVYPSSATHLVIDAGTALTFTASHADGSLRGGSILPGIKTQFDSLTEKTAALPAISPKDDVAKLLQKLKEEGRKVPRFSMNTTEAIVGGVMHAVCASCLNNMKAAREEGGEEEEETEKKRKRGGGLCVVITGGDGHLVYDMLNLELDAGGLEDVHVNNNLHHYGVLAAAAAARSVPVPAIKR